MGSCAARQGLHHRHTLQHGGHFLQGGRSAQAVQAQGFRGFNHRLAVAQGQGLDQAEDIGPIHAAQHLAHSGLLQLAGAEGNRLVGQAQRVAHGAARRTGQQAQRLRLRRHVFLAQHIGQVFANGLGRHGPQIELQAAGEHGNWHFLGVCGGQHKLQILGRFLQGLQHGVKRRVGEHVHLVDHEDLEAPLHRLVDRLFQKGLHLVHTAVAGGVQLGVVDKTAAIDVGTGLADTARCRGDAAIAIRPLAVERFGQYARHRSLAHTTGAGEQVRVVQTLGSQRIGQGLHHMVLPHHFGEIAGAVLAGEHEVRHVAILKGGLGHFSLPTVSFARILLR